MARKFPKEVRIDGFTASLRCTNDLHAIYSVACPCKKPCNLFLELRIPFKGFVVGEVDPIAAEMQPLIDLHNERVPKNL